jgi:hypothetical protein
VVDTDQLAELAKSKSCRKGARRRGVDASRADPPARRRRRRAVVEQHAARRWKRRDWSLNICPDRSNDLRRVVSAERSASATSPGHVASGLPSAKPDETARTRHTGQPSHRGGVRPPRGSASRAAHGCSPRTPPNQPAPRTAQAPTSYTAGPPAPEAHATRGPLGALFSATLFRFVNGTDTDTCRW